MVVNKCYLEPCDLLDIAESIRQELVYGIDCKPVKLCHFAEFYIKGELIRYEDSRSGGGIINDGYSYCVDEDGDGDCDPIDYYTLIDECGGGGIDIVGKQTYEYSFTDYICTEVIEIEGSTTTTTTSSTTTSTTTDPNCICDFIIRDDLILCCDEISTTTSTTTSSTTTTSTTQYQIEGCNIQADIIEITW